MAKRKGKRGSSLPRVTLLAYNRRDLLRFAESVEKLAGLVNDLGILVEKKQRAKLKARHVLPSAEGNAHDVERGGVS